MAIAGVDPKCYILALFVRDDGARFLLGDDPYEFKDKQLHFQQNTIANDVVEVQGNDGYLLAGQVRRPGTQSFDGYVANGTDSKAETEEKRRDFLQFFRRSHFYKVIYVFPNGTAIQRKQGFLVDDPTVQELYQQYPEYHVALNFEDVNYYTYEEDDQGHEIYAEEAIIRLVGGGATGGLIWDENGVVWENPWGESTTVSGTDFQVDNLLPTRMPISDVELQGDTFQQSYSGKNLFNVNGDFNYGSTNHRTTSNSDGTLTSTSNFTSSRSSGQKIEGLVANTTYTLTATIDSYTGAGKPNAGIIQVMDSSGSLSVIKDIYFAVASGIPNTVSGSFTTPSDVSAIWISFNGDTTPGSGAAASATFSRIQLESGSATSYEPYVGGIPSPNPDYPQAIQTVTGEQTVSVTGKNLIDGNYNNLSYFARCSGESFDNGFKITSNGQSGAAYAVLPISNSASLLGKTVVLSYNGTGTGSLYAKCYYLNTNGYSPASEAVAGNISSGSPFTLPSSFPSGTIGFCLTFYTSLNNYSTYTDIQLELGSTATVYEPYQFQSYEINLGKNLWDPTPFKTGYVIAANGTDYATANGVEWEYKNVQPSTSYTISVTGGASSGNLRIHAFDKNGSWIEQIDVVAVTTGNKSTKTFTTPPNIGILRWSFFNDSIDNQLELGSIATSYAAYFTPIELCKIGDYQDYIYKGDDGWYVHKEVGANSINVSEGTLKDYANADYLSVTKPTDYRGYGSYDYYPMLCSHAVVGESPSGGWNSVNGIGGAWVGAERPRVWIGFENGTTLETMRSTLSGAKMYYQLATPTDTKITDADLVAQLEALGAMRLFVGENNILVAANGDNLQATLQFDYYTKYAALGAEWEEGGTKGPTIVDVNAIDNTYPVWELIGPAVNPTISVLTTNTTLTYNGTITASQKLVVDMFNKTATLNGTSVIGNISGDFVYMAPGTNRVAYTAGNTDAPDSTIYWQEVVG